MASDKRANLSGVRMTVTKIRRGEAGNLVGVAGTAALTEDIFHWLCEGGERPEGQGEKSDWCAILEITPEGVIYRHERLGRIRVEDAQYAVGSGADFARAAMAMGATAAEAIKLASKFDTATGDGVDVLHLNPPVRPPVRVRSRSRG